MVINDLLSWNGSVRQYPKGKSAWCLHLRGINCQSDAKEQERMLLQVCLNALGLLLRLHIRGIMNRLKTLAEVLTGKGLNTVILKGDMMGGTIEDRDCVP